MASGTGGGSIEERATRLLFFWLSHCLKKRFGLFFRYRENTTVLGILQY
jgi:hypothetical protein